MNVAKKFLKFIPEQHVRRGIITPFDGTFNPALLNAFIREHDFGCDMTDPNAMQYINHIANPVVTLMRETMVCSMSFSLVA